MTKDQLREEFIKHKDLAGDTGYCNPIMANKIADWWLTKLAEQEKVALDKYRIAFSEILNNEYTGREEAILKAEVAWHELLDKKLADQQRAMVEILEGMKKWPKEKISPDYATTNIWNGYDRALSDVLSSLKEQ